MSNLFYSPIDSGLYEIKNIRLTAVFAWLMILVILIFSIIVTKSQDDVVVITIDKQSDDKVQVMTPEADLLISNGLTPNILNNINNIVISIKTINDQNRGSCLINNIINWNGTNTFVISTDNMTFWALTLNTPCTCNSESFICKMEYTLDLSTMNNWKVFSIPYNMVYFNFNNLKLTTIDNKHMISYNNIGVSLLKNTYSVTGNSQTLSTHSVSFYFNDYLSQLSKSYRSETLGQITTIDFVKLKWNDYLVSFLALSFGLFGFISIIIRVLCYKVKNDMILNK